jgi:SulP family sulfate permease
VFIPKLVTTLKDYNRQQFANDAIAGVIVGIVALPLAIAFAIASGVTPERGLITAIVAGFLISALGGSRVQIGGPRNVVWGRSNLCAIDNDGAELRARLYCRVRSSGISQRIH